MATVIDSPRTLRNPQFWDFDPPFPDADWHRRLQLAAEREEHRKLAGQRWTLTPLAEQLDPPAAEPDPIGGDTLEFSPEIERAAEEIRSAWTDKERLAAVYRVPNYKQIKSPPKYEPQPKRDLKARRIEEVAALYDNGKTQREIAAALNVSRGLVADRIHRIERQRAGGAELSELNNLDLRTKTLRKLNKEPRAFRQRTDEQREFERRVGGDRARETQRATFKGIRHKPACGAVYGICLKAIILRVSGLSVTETAKALDLGNAKVAWLDLKLRDSTRSKATVAILRAIAVAQDLRTSEAIEAMILSEVRKVREQCGWCPKSEGGAA